MCVGVVIAPVGHFLLCTCCVCSAVPAPGPAPRVPRARVAPTASRCLCYAHWHGDRCDQPENLLPSTVRSTINTTIEALIVSIICLLSSLCLCLFTAILCNFRRHEPFNNVIWLLERGIRGEREAIRIHRIPVQALPVQGIPLQQVPLSELRCENLQRMLSQGRTVSFWDRHTANSMPLGPDGEPLDPAQPLELQAVPMQSTPLNPQGTGDGQVCTALSGRVCVWGGGGAGCTGTTRRGGVIGPHARGNAARHVVVDLDAGGEWAANTAQQPPQQPAPPSVCQLLGPANAQTTPQGTPAAAAVRKR